jgi:hypothetical protein
MRARDKAYGRLSAVNLVGMIGDGRLTDRMNRPLLPGCIYLIRGLTFWLLLNIKFSCVKIILDRFICLPTLDDYPYFTTREIPCEFIYLTYTLTSLLSLGWIKQGRADNNNIEAGHAGRRSKQVGARLTDYPTRALSRTGARKFSR